MLYHCNSGFTNTSQCCVLRTLPDLSKIPVGVLLATYKTHGRMETRLYSESFLLEIQICTKNYSEKLSILNLKKYVQWFVGYVYRLDTLWITVTENLNCRTSLSESLQYLILELSKWFSYWCCVTVKRETHKLHRRYFFLHFVSHA